MKVLSGIDSLYYFCESNNNYEDLYNSIINSLEDQKEKLKQLGIQTKPQDLFYNLDEIPLQHLGKAEGFLWFRDNNHFFKLGFKDPKSAVNMHNIRVQLLANGIYGYGLKNILKFINDDLLKDFTTGYYPVTRIDLNAFVTYNFSFIDKSMFVTRKQNYATISEIGSSTKIQTLYVGKPPFRLRIYDKRLELIQNNKKFDLMDEYFSKNGIKKKQSLFNIEFEMHRAHLKYYKLDSLEEVLKKVEMLFKKAMDDIRLVDPQTISDQKNRYRAKTLLVWKQIQEAYKINQFMQNSLPLEKIKRKRYQYELEEFKQEFKALTKRGYIHDLPISIDLFAIYYEEMKKDLGVLR